MTPIHVYVANFFAACEDFITKDNQPEYLVPIYKATVGAAYASLAGDMPKDDILDLLRASIDAAYKVTRGAAGGGPSLGNNPDEMDFTGYTCVNVLELGMRLTADGYNLPMADVASKFLSTAAHAMSSRTDVSQAEAVAYLDRVSELDQDNPLPVSGGN